MTKVFIHRCMRCGRRYRGQADWVMGFSEDISHAKGYLCPDDVTLDEYKEIEFRRVTEQRWVAQTNEAGRFLQGSQEGQPTNEQTWQQRIINAAGLE